MGSNNGKSRRAERKEQAQARQSAYDVLSDQARLARANCGEKERRKIVARMGVRPSKRSPGDESTQD